MTRTAGADPSASSVPFFVCFTLDGEGAFQLLVKSSQDTSMKLTEVARRLTIEVGARQARTAASSTDDAE